MNEDINIKSEDSSVDADTSLADVDISRLNKLKKKINTGAVRLNDFNILFPVNNLIEKTADNLAQAEARTNERPLRTEKTIELEKREGKE